MTNLIFSRRALQKRLQTLETMLSADPHEQLVARLERPGRDRLSAMREAALLPALHNVSPLNHESPLTDGSRPDFAMTYVHHNYAFDIVGDITTVSDKGLHESNPVGQFWKEVVRLARKYRLNPNHFRYDIKSRSVGEYGDSRTMLLMPPRKELSALLKEHVEPFVRGLADGPVARASLPYSAPGVAFTLEYDQTQTFAMGGHASYDVPYSKTKTPLHTALRKKADQLRYAPSHALRVVIVCDADCKAMSRHRATGQGDFSGTDIAANFLRTTSAIDVVLLVTTERAKPFDRLDISLRLRTDFVGKPQGMAGSRLTVEAEVAMKTLFKEVLQALPKPMIDARNAALRCEDLDYGFGFHGGYSMSGKTIRISSRQVLELLAGATGASELNRRQGWHKASCERGSKSA
jgi:hypothetical protein